jgi:hypothetical protein
MTPDRFRILAYVCATAAILAIAWLVLFGGPHTVDAARPVTPIATLPPVNWTPAPSAFRSHRPVPMPVLTLPPTDTE